MTLSSLYCCYWIFSLSLTWLKNWSLSLILIFLWVKWKFIWIRQSQWLSLVTFIFGADLSLFLLRLFSWHVITRRVRMRCWGLLLLQILLTMIIDIFTSFLTSSVRVRIFRIKYDLWIFIFPSFNFEFGKCKNTQAVR